jgi:hypothetical protein
MAVVRNAILFIALLLLTAPAVSAQQIQLTPVIGYRFFGSLTDWTGANISVNDAMSFGGFATYMATPTTGFEFGWMRQDSDATLSRPFNGREKFDVKVDNWTLGSVKQIPRAGSNITPYLNGFLGLTYVSSSDGDDSITKFMLGGGGGAKISPPSAPLGLRLGARAYFTFAGGGGATVGCGTGGCGVGLSSGAFFQLDLLAGLTINLGGRR